MPADVPGSWCLQVCLYLPAYDSLSSYFSAHGAGNFSPLLAGASARFGAVIATSPFELFKTRLQNAQSATPLRNATYRSVWESLALHKQVRKSVNKPPPASEAVSYRGQQPAQRDCSALSTCAAL